MSLKELREQFFEKKLNATITETYLKVCDLSLKKTDIEISAYNFLNGVFETARDLQAKIKNAKKTLDEYCNNDIKDNSFTLQIIKDIKDYLKNATPNSYQIEILTDFRKNIVDCQIFIKKYFDKNMKFEKDENRNTFYKSIDEAFAKVLEKYNNLLEKCIEINDKSPSR